MDPAKYKTVVTSRGITYSYYFASAKPSKPTILFCHGFPSTSKHWEKEILFFEGHGYGIIAPDMLGFGGTGKPTDADAYVPSLVSRDLVEVLDAADLQKVIAIGHDWGSKAVSRLSNHYPERFYAYAFFAVPFVPVTPPVDYNELLASQKAQYGYELYGYWAYMSTKHEFDTDFRAHPDSTFSIWFPDDPALWETNFAPRGALKRTMVSDFVAPLPPYLTPGDKQWFIDTFAKNGFDAPTRWYEVMKTPKSAEDDIPIPESRKFPPVNSPIFFGAAKEDRVCLPQIGYDQFAVEDFKGHDITIREFDGDHWIILSHADKINKELLSWIEETVSLTTDLQ
ncbi:epoxide hydrolase [Trametopsis cervina]|nr:epoxide hydrolase [Trametopsis cervina]